MIVTDFAEGDHPPSLPSARTLERFLTSASAAIPLRGQVSVLITTDKNIRRLNREFRGKNKPTDVLSFPAAQPEKPARGRNRVAGDLAISIDMASRQALVLDHSLSTELKVLILHGLLHLAGFDHEVDKGEMAARELVLRRKLRLPGGLIERTEQPRHAKPLDRSLAQRSRRTRSTEVERIASPSSKAQLQTSLSRTVPAVRAVPQRSRLTRSTR